MILSIISLLFGILSLAGSVPVVLPIIGLALGINAILKTRKKTENKKAVIITASIAIIANGFVSLMFVIGSFLQT